MEAAGRGKRIFSLPSSIRGDNEAGECKSLLKIRFTGFSKEHESSVPHPFLRFCRKGQDITTKRLRKQFFNRL